MEGAIHGVREPVVIPSPAVRPQASGEASGIFLPETFIASRFIQGKGPIVAPSKGEPLVDIDFFIPLLYRIPRPPRQAPRRTGGWFLDGEAGEKGRQS